MSKTLTVVQLALVSFAAQAALALAGGNPDTGPGCGLGKLAWQDYEGQKEIAPQVMMATTNGTFGSTTFGISFGTSGCTNDGVIIRELKAQAFTDAMFANLRQDIARGGGEHLASLATLLGVPSERHDEFFARIQGKYTSLLETGEASPVALVRALSEASAEYPLLAEATPNPAASRRSSVLVHSKPRPWRSDRGASRRRDRAPAP